ncbi:hypothetical protein SPDO_04880 [Sphingomonas dokdonensis]|uniref:Uncharacterized protein n=1 Tax=Sphingomonas dokdonensis TaxID=344880 RepID=A0A245ZV30_9SPHN|nr:hypothetical protein SPDO_04880 [Sphingomonas dokdonensis]
MLFHNLLYKHQKYGSMPTLFFAEMSSQHVLPLTCAYGRFTIIKNIGRLWRIASRQGRVTDRG